MIRISGNVSIPLGEVRFTFSTSGGPGGQNVNKVNTRAALLFDLRASRSLSEPQKELLMRRLRSRISGEGVLRVVSQRHRSQRANREAALERFAELLRDALRRRPPRRRTAVPRAAIGRRLEEKRLRGRRKRERGRPTDDER
jgi:ribosome-associated protein